MIVRQAHDEVPEHVARLKDVMSRLPATWALCGGWAVDAFIGEETRVHNDIDIVIFEEGQRALFEHLQGWDMVAHAKDMPDQGTDERWDGRPLALPAHIHIPGVFHYENGAVLSKDGFVIDAQVNTAIDGEWQIREQVTLPLSEAIYESAWGLPAVAPEVLLLYKSMERRRRDERDFQALLPRLTEGQRRWLYDAIGRLQHPWQEALSEPVTNH